MQADSTYKNNHLEYSMHDREVAAIPVSAGVGIRAAIILRFAAARMAVAFSR
ncbi:hypothetical protein D8I24_3260 (plasmid) [Cupriavidus necator H850]|nr:hypothetical protein D8I24_3260 [Cupriavidus necator H850]